MRLVWRVLLAPGARRRAPCARLGRSHLPAPVAERAEAETEQEHELNGQRVGPRLPPLLWSGARAERVENLGHHLTLSDGLSSMPPIPPEQARLRAVILELLERRGPGKTICPSDAARALVGKDFRPLMDIARAAAAELVADGEIEVTQRGKVVDIEQARGPIRLRSRRR